MTALYLRYAILLFSSVALIVWLLWALRSRRWLYAVAPLAWLLNVTTFYVFRLATVTPDPLFFNMWSLIIILQGVFTLLGVGLTLLLWRRLHVIN
jgi:hypothetical protein